MHLRTLRGLIPPEGILPKEFPIDIVPLSDYYLLRA